MKSDTCLDYEEPMCLLTSFFFFFFSQQNLHELYSLSQLLFRWDYSQQKFLFPQCLNTEEILILFHAACTCLGCKTQ